MSNDTQVRNAPMTSEECDKLYTLVKAAGATPAAQGKGGAFAIASRTALSEQVIQAAVCGTPVQKRAADFLRRILSGEIPV